MLHRLTTFFIALLFLSSVLYSDLSGQKAEFTTDFGTDIIDGFTQYELQFLRVDSLMNPIGGTAHSRLRYPFTAYLGGARIKIEYRGFYGSIAFYTQYNESNSDPMEDKDWVTAQDDYQLWAYGTSNPDPDFRYWQFDVGYEFTRGKNKFRPFFKYSFYHSEFLMTGLVQTTYYDFETGEEFPSPIENTRNGDVLYYEQDLKMPFIGAEIESAGLGEKTILSIELAYSPFAAVDDHDRHLIRTDSLEAWNSGNFGTALHFEMGVSINVISAVMINAMFGYEDYLIDTDGAQSFIRDGENVSVNGVDTEVRGVMRHLKLSVSYIFNL